MRDLLAVLSIIFSVHGPTWMATIVAFAASFVVVYFRLRRVEQRAVRA